ncbi:GTPase [Ottowia pentelensis]|uniref:GTPase n=1 Tax=Ottowia pentelensis TaxID=511108 RepID=UPI0036381492
MPEPLIVAVVGHTNAGKTSLLRTLTRQVDFGEVSERPGTTRHAEALALRLDGQVAARFIDTPGLEDSVALLDFLGRQPGRRAPSACAPSWPGPRRAPPSSRRPRCCARCWSRPTAPCW